MNKAAAIIRIKVLIGNTRRALSSLENELQSIIDSEEKK